MQHMPQLQVNARYWNPIGEEPNYVATGGANRELEPPLVLLLRARYPDWTTLGGLAVKQQRNPMLPCTAVKQVDCMQETIFLPAAIATKPAWPPLSLAQICSVSLATDKDHI